MVLDELEEGREARPSFENSASLSEDWIVGGMCGCGVGTTIRAAVLRPSVDPPLTSQTLGYASAHSRRWARLTRYGLKSGSSSPRESSTGNVRVSRTSDLRLRSPPRVRCQGVHVVALIVPAPDTTSPSAPWRARWSPPSLLRGSCCTMSSFRHSPQRTSWAVSAASSPWREIGGIRSR